ncbi:DUF6502 family protein [Variovorax robiniae]|uniref:DUF6502 family protein n=1 Tax=Variovorax robiniae TaxID=1836199 RepID=A0ABU8XK39_9BURK
MEKTLVWTVAACARVMRPVVRLALAMGVKYPQLEELLRDLMLDEARRAWLKRGTRKPNISQLSVTTGLNRKAVTAKVRDLDGALPRSDASPTARAFTTWLQMISHDAGHRRLPIVAGGGGFSFEDLARLAGRGNVHHRSILEDFLRLNMVREDEGHVELVAEGFVPSEDLQTMLAFLGDNVRDHLLAAVHNTLGAEPRMLERAVFASGVTREDGELIEAFTRTRWQALHHELTREMSRAVLKAPGGSKGRVRVGIYTYFEDDPGLPAAVRNLASGSSPPETK